jgi:phosphoglycolate phosphatase-like HAD superfamily hydrolase
MTDIILVDFAGTLIKTEVLDRANELRSNILNRSLPDAQEHAHSETLYANNREYVQALTGITEDMQIQYTSHKLDCVMLSGSEVQNKIATTLFQIGMFQAAKQYGADMFVEGMIDTLTQLKQQGFRLAIISGVRTDIISGMFQIAGVEIFDHILGQPSRLGISNEQQYQQISELGDVTYVIGDKASDIEPAKHFGCKSIFVDWGHPTGGEEELADYSISQAKQLMDIIN